MSSSLAPYRVVDCLSDSQAAVAWAVRLCRRMMSAILARAIRRVSLPTSPAIALHWMNLPARSEDSDDHFRTSPYRLAMVAIFA